MNARRYGIFRPKLRGRRRSREWWNGEKWVSHRGLAKVYRGVELHTAMLADGELLAASVLDLNSDKVVLEYLE